MQNNFWNAFWEPGPVKTWNETSFRSCPTKTSKTSGKGPPHWIGTRDSHCDKGPTEVQFHDRIPTGGRDLLPQVFIFPPLFKMVPRTDLARQNTIHMIGQLAKLTIASLYFNCLNPPLMYPFKNKQFAVNQRLWGEKLGVKREDERLQNKTDCPEPLKLRKAECQACWC